MKISIVSPEFPRNGRQEAAAIRSKFPVQGLELGEWVQGLTLKTRNLDTLGLEKTDEPHVSCDSSDDAVGAIDRKIV